ncbi:MAG: hypothetical protein JEY79_06740 [Pseudodesulfovibrio sp.]|nr:hypothetical protein [Pseudodesulfovibrio sp.]
MTDNQLWDDGLLTQPLSRYDKPARPEERGHPYFLDALFSDSLHEAA